MHKGIRVLLLSDSAKNPTVPMHMLTLSGSPVQYVKLLKAKLGIFAVEAQKTEESKGKEQSRKDTLFILPFWPQSERGRRAGWVFQVRAILSVVRSTKLQRTAIGRRGVLPRYRLPQRCPWNVLECPCCFFEISLVSACLCTTVCSSWRRGRNHAR